jgi:hypothetical protein
VQPDLVLHFARCDNGRATGLYEFVSDASHFSV